MSKTFVIGDQVRAFGSSKHASSFYNGALGCIVGETWIESCKLTIFKVAMYQTNEIGACIKEFHVKQLEHTE